ncbi:MAG: AAA family ATPase, partial [Oscillospiraceae bacterium]
MELSAEALTVLDKALEYARENSYEYVTPEMILLMLLSDKTFAAAFVECGGDTQALTNDILEYIESNLEKVPDIDPEPSLGVRAMLEVAHHSAESSSAGEICVRHLVHGIWQLGESYAVYFMEKQGISEADLLQEIARIEYDSQDENEQASDEEEQPDHSTGLYAPCLNDILNDVNPLIGREAELDRTIQILCRKDKNNPLHIGEPGVGKTAITYGLVMMIRENRVPEPLAGARVFALDLGGMLAGTQFRGDFEKRFKRVLAEIGKEEKPIIYIDEIHNLAGAGAVGESSFDASNLLKPYLTDGHIRFIGATTF